MPKSKSNAEDIIKFVFQQETIPWAEEQNLYISLHTANPVNGNQSTSEVAYTGYSRVFLDRTASGWNVVEESNIWKAKNATEVAFPQCTGGATTATHVGIGTEPSGAGTLLYTGTITGDGEITAGLIPKFLQNQLVVQEI
jgi:hypothetical protein